MSLNRTSYKLLRTSTFRLAALYLLLFAISVGALLAYVYWNTAGLLERQTDETIRAEVQGLADQYRLRGLKGILETIERRSREQSGSIYLLADANGNRIAGNLQRLPPQAATDEEWIDFPLVVLSTPGREGHVGRAFHADLAGDYELLVGRDVQELRLFADIIKRTLFYTLAFALVLGLGGGLLMSRNFLRRVDSITDASRSIMGGNLGGRMPVSGSGDELDRLAQSLNEMLEQIERLMAGMREVSSNVAHDLKTPLTRLKARVESALRAGKDGDYREALEKTIEESDRLLNTFNALLSIARAESGQLREGLEPLDARAILSDVAELYEPIAEEQDGSLKLDAPEELPVRADRQLLAQAVSNLVDNALKYGLADGKADVTVTGRHEDGSIVIEVSDRGPGIPEADREHVIERFVRLDASRSKPGNGLGLSLVAGVMKLHGGTLTLLDNAPGLKARLAFPVTG